MGKEDIIVSVYPIFHKDNCCYAVSKMVDISKRFHIVMKSKHRLTKSDMHGTLTFYFDNILDRDRYLFNVMHKCIETSHELQIPATLEKKPEASPGTFNIYVQNIPRQTSPPDIRALLPGHVNMYYSAANRYGLCATFMFNNKSTAEKFINLQPPLMLRGNVLKLYFENIPNNTVYNKDVDSHVPGSDVEVSRRIRVQSLVRTLVVDNIPAEMKATQLEELFPYALFVQFHKNLDGSSKESASLFFPKEVDVYKAIQHEPIKLGENILLMRLPDDTKNEEKGISQNVSLPTLVVDNIPPGMTRKQLTEIFYEAYCVKFHENPSQSKTVSASICFPKEIHVNKYLQHEPILFGDNILMIRLPEGPKDNVTSIRGKDFLAKLSYNYVDTEADSKQGANQQTDQRARTAVSRNTQQNRMPMDQRQKQPNKPLNTPGNIQQNRMPMVKGQPSQSLNTPGNTQQNRMPMDQRQPNKSLNTPGNIQQNRMPMVKGQPSQSLNTPGNTQQNRMPMVHRRRQTNPRKRPLNKGPVHNPRSILKGSTSTTKVPPVERNMPPGIIDSFRQDNRPPDMGGVVLASSGVQLPDGTEGGKLMAGCKRSSMGDNRSLNVNPGMQGNRPPNKGAKVPGNQKADIPSLMASTVAPVGDAVTGNRAQTDVPLMPGSQAHTTGINSQGQAENYGHRPPGAETLRDESKWSSQQPVQMEIESTHEQSDGNIQVFDYGHKSQKKDDHPPASKIPKDSEDYDNSMNPSTNWDPENM